MKHEVKIILYPEIHKSKNGEFFERLMSAIFSNQGYELSQNINFTGLEIDLYGKHKIRNEKLLVECKAKQEPKSTEIKNFLFNICMEKKADFGYFLHTEELHHQAAGLVDEWKQKEESKKFVFLGPKQIIEILVDAGKIKPFSINISGEHIIEKITLAYTYLGIYYIVIVNTGKSVTTDFYVFDAINMTEITDLNHQPSLEYARDLTIEQLIKREFADIKHLKHKTNSVQQTLEGNTFVEISDEFISFLQNPGANFTHPQSDNLKLDDIFVYPDLKDLNLRGKQSHISFRNLFDIVNSNSANGYLYAFLGEEGAGKSTICKILYLQYYYKGLIPILVNGEDLSNNARTEIFERAVEKNYNKQYKQTSKFKELSKEKILIIVDDFHKIKVKSNYRSVLIQNICSAFSNIIITGNTLMQFENIIINKTSRDGFKEFYLYSILEFGPKLRYDLVKKWNTIGQDSRLIDINELLRKNDTANNHVLSIIGKNYIPSYPFYILSILQALEGAYNPNSSNYSQHGFYYELIINDSLSKAIKDKKEISLYVNYITSFCYFLFENKSQALLINEFESFHKLYCEKHDVKYNAKTILTTLYDAKIIEINGWVSIPHKYIYYFFVAKYLTNNLFRAEIKEIVQKMCKRLYVEEFSNIIMFLTHLSKDEFIIDELLSNAKSIFSEIPIVRIEEDVNNINKLVKELPKQVLELVDFNEARTEELIEKDNLEKLEKEYDNEETEEPIYDIDENIDSIDLISELILALKNVEILGQVVKKYWGEMTGEQKNEVVTETYFLALRTLNTYLIFMESNSDILVNQIANMIDQKFLKDKFKLERRVETLASEFIFRLCFLSSYGVIHRVTNALGYDKLDSTFENVVMKNPINSIKLIDLSIKLEHYAQFPIKQVEQAKKDLENNKLGFLILRNLVINYLYMFSSDHRLKRKLCHLLGIDLKSQRAIDNISKIKKE